MGKTPAEIRFSERPGESSWIHGSNKDTHPHLDKGRGSEGGMVVWWYRKEHIEKLKMRTLAVKARKTRYKNR